MTTWSPWVNLGALICGIATLLLVLYQVRTRWQYEGEPTEIPSTGAFDPRPGEHKNVAIARTRARFMLQLTDELRLRGATVQEAFEMARSWMRAGEEADLLKPTGLGGE